MIALGLIKQHMEVLGSDGAHVGTVDHLEGGDVIKLAKDDPDAGGVRTSHSARDGSCTSK